MGMFPSIKNNVKMESKTEQGGSQQRNIVQDISDMNDVEELTVKVEPFLGTSSEQNFSMELADEGVDKQKHTNNGTGSDPSKTTKQNLGYNEFAMPGNLKTSFRSGT